MDDKTRTVKCLVARMDGTPESGFAPGSIQPTTGLPVLDNFNQSELPLGFANIEVEGTNVYAHIAFMPGIDPAGRYPALGFRIGDSSVGFKVLDKHGVVIKRCEVLAVGVCISRNEDPDIPPIKSLDPAT